MEIIQTNLYFIKCEQFVKIGVTPHIKKFLNKLQASNPYKITLLKSIETPLGYASPSVGYIYRVLKKYHRWSTWYYYKRIPPTLLTALMEASPETLVRKAYSIESLRRLWIPLQIGSKKITIEAWRGALKKHGRCKSTLGKELEVSAETIKRYITELPEFKELFEAAPKPEIVYRTKPIDLNDYQWRVAPIGFRLVVHPNGRKQLVPRDQELFAVKKVFSLNRKGMENQNIAQYLNKIKMLGYKGGAWDRWVIRHILSNKPYYDALKLFRGYKIASEALLKTRYR